MTQSLCEILKEVEDSHLAIDVLDGKVKLSGNKGNITPSLLNSIKQRKHEIINYINKLKSKLSYEEELFTQSLFQDNYITPNIVYTFSFSNQLDFNALNYAYQSVLKNYQILRTKYFIEDGFLKLDLLMSSLPSVGTDRNQEENFKFFDLENDYKFKVLYTKGENNSYELSFYFSHISVDGFSAQRLLSEFSLYYRSYDSKEEGRALSFNNYSEYRLWQTRNKTEIQSAYWKQYLDDFPLLHSLPTDFPRPEKKVGQIKVIKRHLDAKALIQIDEVARLYKTTPFIILKSLFSLLISRYSGENDVIVGVPFQARGSAQFSETIGCILNTLIFRTVFHLEMTFSDIFLHVRELFLDQLENTYPFQSILKDLKVQPSLSHSPIYQILFDYVDGKDMSLDLGSMKGISKKVPLQSGQIDLSLSLINKTDSLELHWEYDPYIFSEETVNQLCIYYKTLIKACVLDPEKKAFKFPLCENDQLKKLYDYEKKKNTLNQIPEQSLLSLFKSHVKKFPDKIAVIDSSIQWTYQELDKFSSCISGLLKSKGTYSGEVIGVFQHRSAWAIASILGIIKAGGVYLPIDVKNSKGRVLNILSSSKVKTVLTSEKLLGLLDVNKVQNILQVEEFPHLNLTALADDHNETDIQESLCVLYTSGSTGLPKGVVIPERGFIRLLFDKRIKLNREAVWLHLSSMGFDAGNFEIWAAILSGSTLVVSSETEQFNLMNIIQLANQYKVTHAFFTAGLFDQIVQMRVQFSSLKNIIVGGDVLSPQSCLLMQAKHPSLEILNGYGPTENSVFSTLHSVPSNCFEKSKLPIGTAVVGTSLWVVDHSNNLCGLGSVGELVVGGIGLSRGYLNNPLQTNEKFINASLFADIDQPVYRTGDLVRWNWHNQLEFLGRIDNQVKLRGYRIELEEIDFNLMNHSLVRNSVTVVQKKQGIIIAFISLSSADPEAEEKLKKHLLKKLPSYMLPTDYVFVDELPLNTNGKVDRKKLLVNYKSKEAIQGFQFSSKIEIDLFDIWKECLGRELIIDLSSNFFSVGGNSLTAIRLSFLISEKFGIDCSVENIYRSQTFRQQLDLVRKKSNLGYQPLIWRSADQSKQTLICFPSFFDLNLNFNEMSDFIKPHFNLGIFNHPGWNVGEPIFRDLVSYIDFIVMTLKSNLPTKKVNLLGFSAGGIIAHEVAIRLSQACDQVNLILIDVFFDEFSFLDYEEKKMKASRIPYDEWKSLLENGEKRRLCKSFNFEIDDLFWKNIGFSRMFSLYSKFLYNYRPSKIFEGTTYSFYALCKPDQEIKKQIEDQKKYCSNIENFEKVNADHFSILKSQHAQNIASWLIEKIC